MSEELEDRLRNHARSFDSLLSLIPAKLYYGEDVSDQWKRKKQTPEQKRAAKMAKLDPSNWKSAKDVLDERAAATKRKREDDGQSLDDTSTCGSTDLQHAQADENPNSKKRKVEEPSILNQPSQPLTVEEKKQRKAEKAAVKKERVQKEKEKQQRQKARKQAEKEKKGGEAKPPTVDISMTESFLPDQEALQEDKENDQWSTASASEGGPEILSPLVDSGTSSISSIPPSITDQPSRTQKPRDQGNPQSKPLSSQIAQSLPIQSAVDRQAAKARLADAISSFRTARKADDSSSAKPRSRAELLEQRRRKEEAKRVAKKEQRRKEREEAARLEDEEIARRFSPGGSGSLLASPRSPPSKDGDSSSANNFSYGRIEFGDGTKVNPSDLASTLPQHTRKGPQDTQTALLAAQKKAGRLAGLDEEKRKNIQEKDMWLAAKQRAHGERVKDNTSLLKKALKRQENQKKKSEKEWDDRKEGIAKAQEIKQRKRADNLAKRKEEKQSHKAGGKKSKKVKKRPGFEGSFRGRSGSSKKKS